MREKQLEQGSEPKVRVLEVHSAIAELQDSIETTENVTDELLSRICLVQSPPFPQSEGCLEEVGPDCTIARQVFELRMRIKRINAELQDAIERLEI